MILYIGENNLQFGIETKMKLAIIILLLLSPETYELDGVKGMGALAKSRFEIIKTIQDTKVYYLRPETYNCVSDAASEIALNGLSLIYPDRIIHPRGKFYDTSNNEQNSTFCICEGATQPVILEYDIITLDSGICQFSRAFCDLNGEIVFWNNDTGSEVVARVGADIWILSEVPMIQFLVAEGAFVLQLLRKIRTAEEQEVWVTNVNGIQVKDIESNSTLENFSNLDKHLMVSNFLSVQTESENKTAVELGRTNQNTTDSSETVGGLEDSIKKTLPMEDISVYTFLLVVVLVTFYLLDLIIRLTFKCIVSTPKEEINSDICLDCKCHFPDKKIQPKPSAPQFADLVQEVQQTLRNNSRRQLEDTVSLDVFAHRYV